MPISKCSIIFKFSLHFGRLNLGLSKSSVIFIAGHFPQSNFSKEGLPDQDWFCGGQQVHEEIF